MCVWISYTTRLQSTLSADAKGRRLQETRLLKHGPAGSRKRSKVALCCMAACLSAPAEVIHDRSWEMKMLLLRRRMVNWRSCNSRGATSASARMIRLSSTTACHEQGSATAHRCETSAGLVLQVLLVLLGTDRSPLSTVGAACQARSQTARGYWVIRYTGAHPESKALERLQLKSSKEFEASRYQQHSHKISDNTCRVHVAGAATQLASVSTPRTACKSKLPGASQRACSALSQEHDHDVATLVRDAAAGMYAASPTEDMQQAVQPIRVDRAHQHHQRDAFLVSPHPGGEMALARALL